MSGVSGGDHTQDVELNLAPIIDCFTVLITYLLVTASFLSLAALDVGVSATGTAAPATESATPPPMVMSLEVLANGDIKVNVRGGVSGREYPYLIRAISGQRDEVQLLSRLNDIKKRWPTITDASVSAEPNVIYKDMVKVIQKIQEAMPKVFISG
jgi:biopolymer transport protein ExbD